MVQCAGRKIDFFLAIGLLSGALAYAQATPTPSAKPGPAQIPSQQAKPELAQGLELLRNGDFKQSGYFWKKTDYFDNYSLRQRFAETNFVVESEAAKIKVNRRGREHWHAHILQSGLYLEQGKRYELTFRAKVDDEDKPEAPVSMVASVIKDAGSVQVYFEDTVKISENAQWQTFKLAFTSSGTDDFARLDINYGRPASDSQESEQFTLWLDDISLRKVDDTSDPRVGPTGVGSYRPVAQHGQLLVNEKAQLTSQLTGKPVQLRGMSLHGIHWDRPWYYANREVLYEIKEKWKSDLVRIPIYLGQGGYIDDPSVLYTVAQTVDTAIALDLYVLIDWHVHNDAGDPNKYKSQAMAFFNEMAKRYGKYPHVIFEITNEPNGASWSDIKRYADDVVRVIRQHTKNIIIVGTPVWSQEVQTAAEDPIQSPNILYSLHFYAASHTLQAFKAKMEAALAKNAGLFVSEFGSTSYGGNGAPSESETSKWLDYLDRKGISWVYWNLSAENEESAALKPGTSPLPQQRDGWKDSDLTASGRYIKQRLGKPSIFDPSKTPNQEDSSPVKVPGAQKIQAQVTIKSDWGQGYCADVTIVNSSSDPVLWDMSFEIEGKISSAWGAAWQQNGTKVNAKGLGSHASLEAGATMQWGFCANR